MKKADTHIIRPKRRENWDDQGQEVGEKRRPTSALADRERFKEGVATHVMKDSWSFWRSRNSVLLATVSHFSDVDQPHQNHVTWEGCLNAVFWEATQSHWFTGFAFSPGRWVISVHPEVWDMLLWQMGATEGLDLTFHGYVFTFNMQYMHVVSVSKSHFPCPAIRHPPLPQKQPLLLVS